MSDELEELIKKTAEKIPGCQYVSLVGYDGITVTQHIIDANFDVTLYDAEISSIMVVTKQVVKSLNLATEKEIIWLTENAFFIIHPVGEEFFIYATLKPVGSNPGVARIELNKIKSSITNIIYS